MEDKILLGQNSEQAEYYAKLMKKNIKCTSSGNRAYIHCWNKKKLIWEESEDGICEINITRFLKKEIDARIAVLQDENNNADLIKSMIKQRKKLINVTYAPSVWKHAKGLLVDTQFVLKLDKIKHLLPIADGKVVDLKTGEVRDRVRKDYFTVECNVNLLDETHKLKHARNFLMSVCGNNEELFDYTLKYLGYCLTGSVEDRTFIQFYGTGRNGKSKLIKLMQNILGKKFSAILSSDVVVKTGKASAGAASSQLMCLMSARLAVLLETEEGDRLNEATVKSITGEDSIKGRALYRDPVEFDSQAKLIIVTNKLLNLNMQEDSIKDRAAYWTTLARFVNKNEEDLLENEQVADNDFCEKMMTIYLDEFFTLLVREGSMVWYDNKKFTLPKIIKDGLNNYCKELDDMAAFIGENYEIKESGKVERAKFNKRYSEYCRDTSTKPKSSKQVKAYMIKNYGDCKKLTGIFYYLGLELKK